MTTARQLRRTATGLAGSVETTDPGGRVAFAVDGRVFAVLDRADGTDTAVLTLAVVDAEAVRAAHPSACVEAGTVRLPLADVDGQRLNHWVRRAWARQAPAELADRAADAAAARPGEVGDLPAAIGRAATRALADLGVTRLDQVASMSDRELLAVHGVGPKAVRVLRATSSGSG